MSHTADLLPPQRATKKDRFYVGSYTSPAQEGGISVGWIDSDTGKFGPLGLAAEAPHPSFLHSSADRKFVYAVLEKDDRVAAYRVDGDRLILLNQKSSAGRGPCHLWLSGDRVLVSNYIDGTIACFPINADGSLGDHSGHTSFSGNGPDPKRQTGPHAHAMISDQAGQFAVAADLGSDQLWLYHLSQGHLIHAGSVRTAPGDGPRHLTWGPDENFLYVINELGLSITVWRKAPEGTLHKVECHPLLPADINQENATASGIVIHPSSRWLYASIRGHDSLTCFLIEGDGNLTRVENTPATVRIPRGFGISTNGRWLIAAGQASNDLAVFEIDQTSGRLQATGERIQTTSPTMILFP